jgi:hypothetical protein
MNKSISSANTNGAVITERNILTPLRLFIQTSPINFAVASGNRNRLFTGKLHVQIANKLRSPEYGTEVQLVSPFRPTSLPSTFK